MFKVQVHGPISLHAFYQLHTQKASQDEIETVYLTKEDYHSTPSAISST
jgi:hypothetical protein